MSTVKQILSTKGNNVFTSSPDTQVLDALKIMDKKGIGVLVIVDDNGKIKGLFTEGDYISRVLLKNLDGNTLVNTVMTKEVLTIKSQQTVNESMQLMITKDIRYLPVIDDSKLLGVISVGDCVKKVIAEQAQTIGHLEQYIQS